MGHLQSPNARDPLSSRQCCGSRNFSLRFSSIANLISYSARFLLLISRRCRCRCQRTRPVIRRRDSVTAVPVSCRVACSRGVQERTWRLPKPTTDSRLLSPDSFAFAVQTPLTSLTTLTLPLLQRRPSLEQTRSFCLVPALIGTCRVNSLSLFAFIRRRRPTLSKSQQRFLRLACSLHFTFAICGLNGSGD